MVKQVILFCFSLLIFGRIVSWQTIINQTQRDFHRRLNNTRPTLCMHNKDWSGYVTRMTGCADRYHKCIKKKRRANILGLRNVMFPTRSSSTAESQMWGTASPSSGLFWSWMGGGFGRLQLLGVLGWVCSGISKLAEEQGPPQRSDVTNSSRECFAFLFLAVVRSFPERLGKKHSRIIFWSIWDQRVEGAKGLRLKTHGSLRVSLALAPLLPSWFLFLKSQDGKAPPPPKHTLPFTLSKNDSSYKLASFNTPTASVNDFQVGATCSLCSCFIC